MRRLLGQEQERKRSTSVEISPAEKELESQFRQALSTKVRLRRQGEGGRLVIYFYSEEELEALYDHIVRD